MKINVNKRSAWAFASVSALESAVHSKSGKEVQLSVQQLIDCNSNGKGGCKTAEKLPEAAFAYIKQNGGLDRDDCYPVSF